MAQDLTVNIKTTSDVPQAMDKAKSATVSFSKQVEDIGKKFSTSFKDIFLSFLGPMALLTGAIAIIGKMIADNEKKRADAHQAAINDTNELMSAEDRYYSKKLERERKGKEKVEEAETARVEVTREFLMNDPRRNEVVDDMTYNQLGAGRLADKKDIQDKVQKIIAEDAKKNPEAGVLLEKNDKEKNVAFKGPEGFGSVIGVGANPVMEKMTRQNEILEEIKIILQEQSLINRGGMVPSPFTEAVPLTLQKMGAV